MNKIHLSSVDSTNTYLKNNYQELNNYTFVSSDKQTAGRGRNSREWKSENGKNLLFSLLILDKELIKHFKEISIITAYSLIQELEELEINNLMIKWPNDVFVGDRKIAGVLLESVTKEEMESLIVGVGLNVNQMEFIGDYNIAPTSINKELNKEIVLEDLKDKIYKRLIDNLEKLKENHDFYPYIIKYDYLKGKTAYTETKEVKIKGINKDYSLSIYNKDTIENIEAGEISFHK